MAPECTGVAYRTDDEIAEWTAVEDRLLVLKCEPKYRGPWKSGSGQRVTEALGREQHDADVI